MKFRPAFHAPALVLAGAVLTAPPASAQNSVFLLDRDGNSGRLSQVERDFIVSRFEMLDLADCNQVRLSGQPRLDYRRLEVAHARRCICTWRPT